MTLSLFLKLYAIALAVFMAIDLLWLGVVAGSFYRAQLGPLMRAEVSWPPAILFYLLFVGGIIVLAVWPAMERESLGQALMLGAVFGLVTYAAYDLTNLATLKGFPVELVVLDMIWGTALSAAVSVVTWLASSRLF